MREHQGVRNEADHGPRQWGCFVYPACGLVVLALAVWIGLEVLFAEAKAALDSEMERIIKRGEPLRFGDLAPAAVDAETDGAPLLLQAVSKIQVSGRGVYDLLNADPPTDPGEFQPVLAANRPALALLSQAVRKPRCYIPYDFTTKQPLAITLDHLQQCRELSRLLSADVLYSHSTGDQKRAIAAVEENLDLSELLQDEPFLIAQLVRIAIAHQAIGSLQTTAGHVDLTPEQFSSLDDRLASMESRFNVRASIVAERALLLTAMENIEENRGMVDGLDDKLVLKWRPKFRYARPALMREQAFMLRTMSELADLVDKTGPEGIQAVSDLKARFKRGSADFVLTQLLDPLHNEPYAPGLRHRQRLITARLGMRVARYRAEHGGFPDSLDEIVDQWLTTGPVDLFSGKELVYRLTTDGFAIYPVGEDGVDNGGGMEPDPTEGACKFEVKMPKAHDVAN